MASSSLPTQWSGLSPLLYGLTPASPAAALDKRLARSVILKQVLHNLRNGELRLQAMHHALKAKERLEVGVIKVDIAAYKTQEGLIQLAQVDEYTSELRVSLTSLLVV